MDIKETIIKAIKDSGKPLRTGEIVEKTRLVKKDVDKAIKKMKEEGVLNSPKRCFVDIKR